MNGFEGVIAPDAYDGPLVRIRRWELYALVAEVFALIAALAIILRPATSGETPLIAAVRFAVSLASILLILAPIQSILARTYFHRETTLGQFLFIILGGGAAGFAINLLLNSIN